MRNARRRHPNPEGNGVSGVRPGSRRWGTLPWGANRSDSSACHGAGKRRPTSLQLEGGGAVVLNAPPHQGNGPAQTRGLAGYSQNRLTINAKQPMQWKVMKPFINRSGI